MKRRVLLRAATAGAAGLLAGCLDGEGNPDGAGTADSDGSPSPTDEATPLGTGGDATDEGADSTDAETDDEGTAEPTDDEGSTGDGTSGEESGQGEATPTDEDDGSSSGSGSAGSNAIVDRSFEVGGAKCGQGEQRADVTRGEARVDVDGTSRGRNGCYTAELADATYDDGADELTITVRAYEDGDGQYCQQCIVDIDYRASVEFEDGTPATVRVLHDGEQVTTA